MLFIYYKELFQKLFPDFYVFFFIFGIQYTPRKHRATDFVLDFISKTHKFIIRKILLGIITKLNNAISLLYRIST